MFGMSKQVCQLNCECGKIAEPESGSTGGFNAKQSCIKSILHDIRNYKRELRMSFIDKRLAGSWRVGSHMKLFISTSGSIMNPLLHGTGLKRLWSRVRVSDMYLCQKC